MTTSLLDSTPARQRRQLSKYNDIETLLTGIGMQHHVQHFIDGEIDMTVFPTLTESDLINLGVKPLGARRRIMMVRLDLILPIRSLLQPILPFRLYRKWHRASTSNRICCNSKFIHHHQLLCDSMDR
jgi:hypothetical protein